MHIISGPEGGLCKTTCAGDQRTGECGHVALGVRGQHILETYELALEFKQLKEEGK